MRTASGLTARPSSTPMSSTVRISALVFILDASIIMLFCSWKLPRSMEQRKTPFDRPPRGHLGTLISLPSLVTPAHDLKMSQTGEERFSLPFFLSPDPSVVVVPLQECLAAGEMPKFEPHPIGPRHGMASSIFSCPQRLTEPHTISVKGMMSGRPNHPFVIGMKARGVREEDFSYEMLSQPTLSV